jgi:hypothetical protein
VSKRLLLIPREVKNGFAPKATRRPLLERPG